MSKYVGEKMNDLRKAQKKRSGGGISVKNVVSPKDVSLNDVVSPKNVSPEGAESPEIADSPEDSISCN